jgi:aminoglycoside phosphotransferase (APT) family kinase protein
VHAFGNDAVAKLPMPDTPEAWIRIEAEYSAAVHDVGAPVPEFLGFDEHEGRVVSIYRRAFGERMWETVLDHPERAEEHGRRLVELQELFASLVPPIVLPNQVDRIRSKIRIAARYADPQLDTALTAVPSVDRVVLCHGDLHPSNVILCAAGPMVVDWFDASRGDPVGDVARTMTLLAADPAPEHLAGARGDILTRLRSAYLEAAADAFGFDGALFERWQTVVVAARVAECLPAETMREIWRQWVVSDP